MDYFKECLQDYNLNLIHQVFVNPKILNPKSILFVKILIIKISYLLKKNKIKIVRIFLYYPMMNTKNYNTKTPLFLKINYLSIYFLKLLLMCANLQVFKKQYVRINKLVL